MLAMSCKRRNGLTIGSRLHSGLDEVAFSWKLPCLYDATSVNLTASHCESGCTQAASYTQIAVGPAASRWMLWRTFEAYTILGKILRVVYGYVRCSPA